MNGSEAISDLVSITNLDGTNLIDKTTMPDCAVVNVASGFNETTEEVIYVKGRDIGAYISYLTIVNQEYEKRFKEICAKDNTYSWC